MPARVPRKTLDLGPSIEPDRQALRALVRSFYDGQHLRVIVGNRLTANFRVRLGQEPGTPGDELDAEAQKIIMELKEHYKRLADGLARADRRKWQDLLRKEVGIISTPEELVLTHLYITLEAAETNLGHQIAALVKEFPIWGAFLEGVRGVGPILAAIIISELDPHKARNPSSYFRFCGLDVGPDGRGRSKRAEHLVKRTFTNKDGEEAERDSITYNPFIKTKLMGVLGSSFLRSASPYRKLYDDYKHRMESHPIYGTNPQLSLPPQESGPEGEKIESVLEGDGEIPRTAKSSDQAKGQKAHRHMMATRYMIKIFLIDLWYAMREVEGLPIVSIYAEAKLGMRPHGSDPIDVPPVLYSDITRQQREARAAEIAEDKKTPRTKKGKGKEREPNGEGDSPTGNEGAEPEEPEAAE